MIKRKIDALVQLGDWLKSDPDPIELAMLKSKRDNAWFDIESQRKAIHSIANHYLDRRNLEKWVSSYEDVISKESKKVGLIAAGNIPAVGFHDLLCIYLSGHKALVKLSEKDAHLLPAMFNRLSSWDKEVSGQIHFVQSLKDVEALIATGSDNSKRYFEHYFGHLPNIIRGNRNSLALIGQSINDDQLYRLGKDVFDYYGLGCRSVSQILIPGDFNENRLLDAWEQFGYVMDNSKYENNFKYNYATFILNREVFKTNNFLILKESKELVSRIACLHFMRYENLQEAESYLDENLENIQVCVTHMDNLGSHVNKTSPGTSQEPSLDEYADRIDTMQFLNNL